MTVDKGFFTVNRVFVNKVFAIDYVKIKKRETIPAHYHKMSYSYLICLSNQGSATVQGITSSFRFLRLIKIPRGSIHSINGASSTVSFLAFNFPPLPLEEEKHDFFIVKE